MVYLTEKLREKKMQKKNNIVCMRRIHLTKNYKLQKPNQICMRNILFIIVCFTWSVLIDYQCNFAVICQ